MQNVLYIDSIFVINFVMDLLLLTLTAKTLKKTATFLRLSAGSLLGAAGYCLVIVLPQVPYLIKVVFGMLPITAGMLKISCKVKGIRELICGAGYLFTYSFFLGGFMLFLRNRIPLLREKESSVWLLLLTGYIGFRFCLSGINKWKQTKQNHFCRVKFKGDKEPINVWGLIDTGNGLTEPVSGKTAAILEEDIWEKMTWAKKPEKFKVIPFHSIGKEHGLLEGYEVESLQIEYEEEKRELTHILVAVYKGKLSVKGDYRMILPPQWLS